MSFDRLYDASRLETELKIEILAMILEAGQLELVL